MPEEDVIDLGPEVPDFSAPSLGQVPPQNPPMTQAPMPPLPIIRRGLPIPPPGAQPMALPTPQEAAEEQRNRREQQFLKQTYEHATSVAQAVQDVAAARRLLGVMRMDEARRSGMDPREAAYKNFSYFSQPGDKSFAPDMRAIAPPPRAASPYMTNFAVPGSKDMVNAVIAPTPTGGNAVHIVPRSALSQEQAENLPKIIELEGEKYVVNPHTGHFERKDKGKTVAELTPNEMGRMAESRARILQTLLKSSTDKTERTAHAKELSDINAYLKDLSMGVRPIPTQNKLVAPPAGLQSSSLNPLTREAAIDFLKQSGGDKEKDRKMARDAGFSF